MHIPLLARAADKEVMSGQVFKPRDPQANASPQSFLALSSVALEQYPAPPFSFAWWRPFMIVSTQ